MSQQRPLKGLPLCLLVACAQPPAADGPAGVTPGATPAPTSTSSAVSPRPPATGASRELAWLLGCWRTVSEDTENIERWRPGAAGQLEGDSRTTRRGEVVHRETLSIARDGQGLTYTATPSDQTRTSFRAVQQDNERVVFENLDHDYPQRIIYERTTPQQLRARIEGVVAGELKSGEWEWTQVPCEPR